MISYAGWRRRPDESGRCHTKDAAKRRSHALHQVEGGEKVTEVCRRVASASRRYRWRKQFTGLGLLELRELRSLRHENSKLKQVVADLTLDRHILQEIVRKKL